MANEITISVNVSVLNGALNDSFHSSGQYNQTTAVEHPDEVTAVTTGTGTQMPIGAVAGGSEGRLSLQNMDPTNYVQLGIVVSAAFQPVIRLPPGPAAGVGGAPQTLDMEPGVTYWLLANTASCLVKMLLLQK